MSLLFVQRTLKSAELFSLNCNTNETYTSGCMDCMAGRLNELSYHSERKHFDAIECKGYKIICPKMNEYNSNFINFIKLCKNYFQTFSLSRILLNSHLNTQMSLLNNTSYDYAVKKTSKTMMQTKKN